MGMIARAGIFTLVLAAMVAVPQSFGGELIEPTRTLGGPEMTWGGLTVFSEPPQLDVYLDGKKVGSTPLWLRQVESGSHKLKIREAEQDVLVREGKITRIGLLKGSFVTFTEVEAKKAAPERLKEAERQPAVMAPSDEPKTEDLSLWEKFVNGSLKHF